MGDFRRPGQAPVPPPRIAGQDPDEEADDPCRPEDWEEDPDDDHSEED